MDGLRLTYLGSLARQFRPFLQAFLRVLVVQFFLQFLEDPKTFRLCPVLKPGRLAIYLRARNSLRTLVSLGSKWSRRPHFTLETWHSW